MRIKDNVLSNLKSNLSPFNHPDRMSGGLLMIVACIAFFEAWHLPFGSAGAPDAGFFPLSLSALLFVFAFAIVLNSFLTEPRKIGFSARSWYVAIAAASFIIYALWMVKAGFVLATTIIMLLFMRGFGGMSWLRATLIVVPSVLLSYFAFVWLGVPLPRGLLHF